MNLNVRSRYARPAFALLVSLSVAGTCLAAPALALADDAASRTGAFGLLAASADAARAEEAADPAAAPAEAEPAVPAEADETAVAADEATADEGATVFGGVQIAIPEDYIVTQAGGMLLAGSEDGTVINLISAGTVGADAMEGIDDLEAFFGPMAEEAAAGAAGTLSDQGVVTLADGTEVYACTIDVVSDGAQVVMHQFYVPLANGGLTLAQFAYEAEADEAAVDRLADIANTLVLAPASDGSLVDFEGAGIALKVADVLVLDGATVDTEPTWYSADGTMMFGLIPQLMDSASALTDADYDMLYTEIASSLGGEPWETTTVAADGVDVKLGGFSFEEDGDLYVGILGLVVAADDTLTGIMAMMPADQVDLYGSMLDTMYESISVLE